MQSPLSDDPRTNAVRNGRHISKSDVDGKNNERVDLVSGKQNLHCLTKFVGACRSNHVHGISNTGSGGQKLPKFGSWFFPEAARRLNHLLRSYRRREFPSPPALVRMATRRPLGRGWASSAAARSNISSMVSARMTPGLMKQRVHRYVTGGKGGGMGTRRAQSCRASSGL